MNETCGKAGSVAWALAGIAVLIGAILWIATTEQKLPPTVSFVLPYPSCNFSASDGSGNYSATITGKADYDANVKNVLALIAKYDGDLLNQNVSNNSPYANNASATSYTLINTTYITANIPLQDTSAFMSDITAETPTSSQLSDVTYSKTTGAALSSNCIDYLNSMKTNEAMLSTYFRELPTYVKSDETNTSTIAYNNGSANNVDDLNYQIQNAYASITSNNDDVATLYQMLNKTSVSITVQDNAEPAYDTETPGAYGGGD